MGYEGAIYTAICGGTIELCNRDCINCPKCNTTTTNKTKV